MYIYREEFSVNIELWDSVNEKHNELYLYSQNNVKGKQGVVMVVDAQAYNRFDESRNFIKKQPSQDELNERFRDQIADLRYRIKLLNESTIVPIFLFFINMPTDTSRVEQLKHEML